MTFVHFTKDFELHFSPSKEKKIPFLTKKTKQNKKQIKKGRWGKRGEAVYEELFR